MTRYADPSVCPDCGAGLPVGPVVCPRCALPLQGPLAAELLSTLARADLQLAALRASVAPVGPLAPLPVGSLTAGVSAYPAPAPRTTPGLARTGLSSASVPKILLGLGALALLVAAVIFLSVAWSYLGLGGRTAVLVALTVASGAAGVWLHSRDLRLAGEALVAVALGLLCLDLVGADGAGWLGDPGAARTTIVIGVALMVASAGVLVVGHLVVPQLVAPLGLALVTAGLLADLVVDVDTAPVTATLVLSAAVAGSVALAHLGRTQQLAVLVRSGLASAALWWAALVVTGLATTDGHANLHDLWVDGHGYGLLAAALLALLGPGAPAAGVSTTLARQRTLAAQPARAVAATIGTVAVGIAWTDDGATVLVAAALVLVLGWSAVAYAAPDRGAFVARFPLALAALPLLWFTLVSLGLAAVRVLQTGPTYSRAVDARLDGADAVASPALLVPAVLALLVGAYAAWPRAEDAGRSVPALPVPRVVPAVVALVLAGVVTIALLPVPLWTVVLGTGASAAALVLDAHHRGGRSGQVSALVALALGAVTLLAALPSEVLATAAAGLLVALATAVLLSDRVDGSVAGLVLPVAAGVLLWSACEVVGLVEVDRGVPVLLLVGALSIRWPRWTFEASALVVGTVASGLAIAAADQLLTALAVHLTVAGALMTGSGLLHRDRSVLKIPGAVLLAAATWVRLADLGVTAPEAYTLPVAVLLVGLGVRRLWTESASTTAATLTPGLLLAGVPSLLWVLVEPLSLRAALLGLGCLAVVLTGTRLRWHAPVLVGAVVGAVVVLRELAPVAAQTPQWVVIGLAGALLTVVGVTWEKRLRDLQGAAAYLDRLR